MACAGENPYVGYDDGIVDSMDNRVRNPHTFRQSPYAAPYLVADNHNHNHGPPGHFQPLSPPDPPYRRPQQRLMSHAGPHAYPTYYERDHRERRRHNGRPQSDQYGHNNHIHEHAPPPTIQPTGACSCCGHHRSPKHVERPIVQVPCIEDPWSSMWDANTTIVDPTEWEPIPSDGIVDKCKAAISDMRELQTVDLDSEKIEFRKLDGSGRSGITTVRASDASGNTLYGFLIADAVRLSLPVGQQNTIIDGMFYQASAIPVPGRYVVRGGMWSRSNGGGDREWGHTITSLSGFHIWDAGTSSATPPNKFISPTLCYVFHAPTPDSCAAAMRVVGTKSCRHLRVTIFSNVADDVAHDRDAVRTGVVDELIDTRGLIPPLVVKVHGLRSGSSQAIFGIRAIETRRVNDWVGSK